MSQDVEETKWEPAIRAFEEEDCKTPPPRGALLFTGSSTIAMWETLQEDFPFAPVINRGFGGSQMRDLVRYARRVILPYQPRVAVVYSGDNDLAAGKAPEDIAADLNELADILWNERPELPLVVIDVKPSPARWHLRDEILATNRLEKDFVAQHEQCYIVRTFDEMLGEDGTPDDRFYADDGLHLSADGYRLWTELVAPTLKLIWRQE